MGFKSHHKFILEMRTTHNCKSFEIHCRLLLGGWGSAEQGNGVAHICKPNDFSVRLSPDMSLQRSKETFAAAIML